MFRPLIVTELEETPSSDAICCLRDASSAAPSGSADSSLAVSLPSDRAVFDPRVLMYFGETDSFIDEPTPAEFEAIFFFTLES